MGNKTAKIESPGELACNTSGIAKYVSMAYVHVDSLIDLHVMSDKSMIIIIIMRTKSPENFVSLELWILN